jgi:rod shape-determining protein MreD
LTIPFAALTALFAALLETTVLPEIPIAGATPDLVLVVAVSATLLLGIEDGLIAAFLGGLLIDMLVPQRPLGAATLSLLLVVGIAAAVARVAGPSRRWLTVALTVVLTPVLHIVLGLVLVLTEGAPLAFDFTAMLVAAFMNGLLAIPVSWLFGALEQRFGTAERVDW